MKYSYIEFESGESEGFQLFMTGEYSFFMLMTEDNFIKFKDGIKFTYFDSSRLYFSTPCAGKWYAVIVPKRNDDLPEIILKKYDLEKK